MTAPSPQLTPDISVVISTFNRAGDLEQTLPAVLEQDVGCDRFEVIVVDNNSIDDTAEVLKRLASRYPHLRAAQESRPGSSHGRNRGILLARAPIVAITDDDTEVGPNWLGRILQVFAESPGAAFIGGPVLPRWATPKPRWLTRAHWGPLAIVDYGRQRLTLGPHRPLCLLTANFAVRKSALDRVGLFAPAFRRCQDHELQFRMWEAGLTGVYEPSLLAWTTIPPERLRKSYHRMWHRRNSLYHALMPTRAMFDPPMAADAIVSLWGVPAFVFRQIVRELVQVARSYVSRREDKALEHEAQLWYFLGYVQAQFTRQRLVPKRQRVAGLWRFTRQLAHRKFRFPRYPHHAGTGSHRAANPVRSVVETPQR